VGEHKRFACGLKGADSGAWECCTFSQPSEGINTVAPSANAGIAIATIIAAITNATVPNIMMRLIMSATSFGRERGAQPRLKLYNATTLAIASYRAHHANE
jgi:hypothetical protein